MNVNSNRMGMVSPAGEAGGIGISNHELKRMRAELEARERQQERISPRDFVIINYPLLVRRGQAQEILNRLGIPQWRFRSYLTKGKIRRITLPPTKQKNKVGGYCLYSRDELLNAALEQTAVNAQ